MASIFGQAAVAALAIACMSHATAAGDAAGSADRAAFERLKSLAGDWQGRIDDEQGGAPVAVRYQVVSNGKAVIEHMFPDTPHDMVTIYYVASGRLQATHYCEIGNQPAFLLAPKSTADEIVFDFAGGTGFDPDRDHHAHDTWIRIVDADRIVSHWTFFGDGAKSGEVTSFLTRTAPVPADDEAQ